MDEPMDVEEITVEEAKKLHEEDQVVFIDVRDPYSYKGGHIDGAVNLSDANVRNYIESGDKTKKHIIYCYHGHSSLGGAAYFKENGYSDSVSMRGGYAEWSRLDQ